MLPTAGVFAAAGYLRHSGIFGVLTVFATVLAIVLSHTLANTMRALLIVCHKPHPRFLVRFVIGGLSSMLEPQLRLVKHIKARYERRACGAARLT